ncbi:hypothetical protein O3P69_004884 [Scylla paramamosain]|uniref:Uncharacterized protein n=1 Tax=Scylla paramamosain TaxID=85552 RepID=A0AAW0UEZ3_SCYPA
MTPPTAASRPTPPRPQEASRPGSAHSTRRSSVYKSKRRLLLASHFLEPTPNTSNPTVKMRTTLFALLLVLVAFSPLVVAEAAMGDAPCLDCYKGYRGGLQAVRERRDTSTSKETAESKESAETDG